MKLYLTSLTFFLLSFGYANSFEFDLTKDSLKTIDEKYDSLKYSFLPKYEIYGRYFNPFTMTKSSYWFDFGFKWHVKKRRYFTSHFIARSTSPLNYYELLTFSQMHRLTYKIEWIHLELSYGLAGSHYYNTTAAYTANSFGLGAIFRSELQFDVGPIANISLGFDATPNFSYSFREPTDSNPAPETITNGIDFWVFSQNTLSFIYVGFNFYIK